MGDVEAPGEPTAEELSAAWAAAEGRLPQGWRLDSLRCASSGLDPDQRSTDWIAVAGGPHGEERTFQAPDALSALAGLASGLPAR